eukprot:scaffold103135_cov71-Cyclotella_meneghiniana.AAC.7
MDYIYGKVNIKCVYDDSRVYFNFKIPGPYRHDPEDKHKSPAVSTMFQIGSNATLYNHGDCPYATTSCPNDECTDYMVDFGYWETYQVGTVPLDGHAYSLRCRSYQDKSDWESSWSHASPNDNSDLGVYSFEMSRPLRTSTPETDAQLESGKSIGFGFSYWVSER